MASETIASASKPRGFLATPNYLRLWFAGGIGNAMRWLELLVAGIFTYEVTQSAFLVALVIVARSLPMLLIGSIAGVIGEAMNRKRLLVTQLLVLAASSAVLCVLVIQRQRLAGTEPNTRARKRSTIHPFNRPRSRRCAAYWRAKPATNIGL